MQNLYLVFLLSFCFGCAPSVERIKHKMAEGDYERALLMVDNALQHTSSQGDTQVEKRLLLDTLLLLKEEALFRRAQQENTELEWSNFTGIYPDSKWLDLERKKGTGNLVLQQVELATLRKTITGYMKTHLPENQLNQLSEKRRSSITKMISQWDEFLLEKYPKAPNYDDLTDEFEASFVDALIVYESIPAWDLYFARFPNGKKKEHAHNSYMYLQHKYAIQLAQKALREDPIDILKIVAVRDKLESLFIGTPQETVQHTPIQLVSSELLEELYFVHAEQSSDIHQWQTFMEKYPNSDKFEIIKEKVVRAIYEDYQKTHQVILDVTGFWEQMKGGLSASAVAQTKEKFKELMLERGVNDALTTSICDIKVIRREKERHISCFWQTSIPNTVTNDNIEREFKVDIIIDKSGKIHKHAVVTEPSKSFSIDDWWGFFREQPLDYTMDRDFDWIELTDVFADDSSNLTITPAQRKAVADAFVHVCSGENKSYFLTATDAVMRNDQIFLQDLNGYSVIIDHLNTGRIEFEGYQESMGSNTHEEQVYQYLPSASDNIYVLDLNSGTYAYHDDTSYEEHSSYGVTVWAKTTSGMEDVTRFVFPYQLSSSSLAPKKVQKKFEKNSTITSSYRDVVIGDMRFLWDGTQFTLQ